MVGPSEVDDMLEAETKQECSKVRLRAVDDSCDAAAAAAAAALAVGFGLLIERAFEAVSIVMVTVKGEVSEQKQLLISDCLDGVGGVQYGSIQNCLIHVIKGANVPEDQVGVPFSPKQLSLACGLVRGVQGCVGVRVDVVGSLSVETDTLIRSLPARRRYGFSCFSTDRKAQ